MHTTERPPPKAPTTPRRPPTPPPPHVPCRLRLFPEHGHEVALAPDGGHDDRQPDAPPRPSARHLQGDQVLWTDPACGDRPGAPAAEASHQVAPPAAPHAARVRGTAPACGDRRGAPVEEASHPVGTPAGVEPSLQAHRRPP